MRIHFCAASVALAAALVLGAPAHAAETYTLTWMAGATDDYSGWIYLQLPPVQQGGYGSAAACEHAMSDNGGVYDLAKSQVDGYMSIYGNGPGTYRLVVSHICTLNPAPGAAPALLRELSGRFVLNVLVDSAWCARYVDPLKRNFEPFSGPAGESNYVGAGCAAP